MILQRALRHPESADPQLQSSGASGHGTALLMGPEGKSLLGKERRLLHQRPWTLAGRDGTHMSQASSSRFLPVTPEGTPAFWPGRLYHRVLLIQGQAHALSPWDFPRLTPKPREEEAASGSLHPQGLTAWCPWWALGFLQGPRALSPPHRDTLPRNGLYS